MINDDIVLPMSTWDESDFRLEDPDEEVVAYPIGNPWDQFHYWYKEETDDEEDLHLQEKIDAGEFDQEYEEDLARWEEDKARFVAAIKKRAKEIRKANGKKTTKEEALKQALEQLQKEERDNDEEEWDEDDEEWNGERITEYGTEGLTEESR